MKLKMRTFDLTETEVQALVEHADTLGYNKSRYGGKRKQIRRMFEGKIEEVISRALEYARAEKERQDWEVKKEEEANNALDG